jgi:hypothetical protein
MIVAEGKLPSMSIISWEKRFNVTPESVSSKNDCGACKTVCNNIRWSDNPDSGVIRL